MKKQGTLFLLLAFLLGSILCTFGQIKHNHADAPPGIFDKITGTLHGDQPVYVGGFANKGGYAAVGYTARFAQPFDDILIIRLDHEGNVIYSRTLRTPSGEQARGISRRNQHNFFVAGYAPHPGGNLEFDPVLIKMDNDGNTIWANTYGDPGTGFGDQFSAVTHDGNGGAFATGRMYSSVLATKVDSNGNVQWAGTHGMGGGNSVIQTSDGGYLIVGENSVRTKVIKLSANGTREWVKEYGNGVSMSGKSVVENDKGYLVAGVANRPLRGDDGFLMQLDFLGDTMWTKAYGNPIDNTFSMVDLFDDSSVAAMAIAGTYHHGSNGNKHSWMMTLDEDGDTLAQSFYQSRSGGVELTGGIINNYGGILGIGLDFGSYRPGDGNFYFLSTDTILRSEGCPPINLNISDFTIDDMSVTITNDTVFNPLSPELLPITFTVLDTMIDTDTSIVGEFTGAIKLDNFPFTKAIIEVYGAPDGDTLYHPLGDTIKVDSTGKWKWDYNQLFDSEYPYGDKRWPSFYIAASPDTIPNHNVLKTYAPFGVRWYEATKQEMNGCKVQQIPIDMTSYQPYPLGNGTFGGQVIAGKDHPDLTLESPIPNIPIILRDENHIVIGQSLTDENGRFQFEDVPDFPIGRTYEFDIDIPALALINPHENISPHARFSGDPSYDYVVGRNTILGIVTTDTTTAIHDPLTDVFQLSLAPNPAQEEVRVEFLVPESEASLVLTDMLGREVYRHHEKLGRGTHSLRISLTTMDAGLYIARVESTTLGMQLQKLLIK
ncbi:MAG: T9SS type A sorting domain-containing protein [Bacteroidota bacterium]